MFLVPLPFAEPDYVLWCGRRMTQWALLGFASRNWTAACTHVFR